jgi:hypothetical protein
MMANNILVQESNGNFAIVATTEVGGVHTLTVTTAAANSAILLRQPNGEWLRLATVQAGGVHTICVSP